MYAKAEERLGVAQPPPDLHSTYHDQYAAAAAAAGLPTIADPVARTNGSAGYWRNSFSATPAGVRVHSAAGYLLPALNGPCAHNLRLVESAMATRILVEGGRAVGVEYAVDGDEGGAKVVVAMEEVIISAGPFMSPRLLQLSGIGPAKLLQELGIEVVVNLPVGQSAQVCIFTYLRLRPAANAFSTTCMCTRTRHTTLRAGCSSCLLYMSDGGPGCHDIEQSTAFVRVADAIIKTA